jgi:hypothetical protein
VSLQDRCTNYAKCTIALELFWTLTKVLLDDKAQVEARFIHLEIVLILTQDGCTVCVERTAC